jgi:outer membrane protein OmpA-like peptidoglycan-associated protein
VKWSIHRTGDSNNPRRSKLASPIAAIAVVASFVVPCAGITVAATVLQGGHSATAGAATSTPYPLGTPNTSEPSGMAPPSASALSGYGETYVNDFAGTTLPAEWTPFNGSPSGDPGGMWLPSQVQVNGGVMSLTTQQLSAYGSDWISGGVSLGTLPQTYGAWFVRSRMTGPGPTQVELLWPTQGWPPEVDFDETYGDTALSQATDHYDANNDLIHNNLTEIGSTPLDMTQWHTWGIVWTPTSIIYTVDGQEWASVTQSNAIPNVPMTLNIQQQTWCSAGWACPTAGSASQTLVDWVAIYAPGATSPVTTTSPPTTTVPPTTTTTKPTTTTTKPTTTTTKPTTTTTTTTTNPTTTTTKPTGTTTTTTTTTNPVTTTTTAPSLPPTSSVAQSVAVSPFAVNSASLSAPLRSQVVNLARTIKNHHSNEVLLVGMAGHVTAKRRLAVSLARADAVARLLRTELKAIHAKGVVVSAFAQYSFNGATLGKVLTSKLKTPSVVALIH